MPRDGRGLRLLDRMLIAYDELGWMQDEIDYSQRMARLGTLHQAGWVAEWIGPTPNLGWRIYDAGSGELAISPTDASGVDLRTDPARPADTDVVVLGVDRNGRILEQRMDGDPPYLFDGSDTRIVVPNDGVWRTLVARHRTQQRELGSLQITGGSVSVVGVGTQFTRLQDSSVAGLPGSMIRIDPTDTSAGNEGTYVVDTITDDENMTFTTAPPTTEADVLFRVMGRFRGTVPTDPDIHNVAVVEWELVTRTTTRPADGGLIAYDVMRTGAVLYTIDRRRGQVFRPYTGRSRPALGLTPALRLSGSSSSSLSVSQGTEKLQVHATNGYYAVAVSMAPAATGSHLTDIAEDQPTGMLLAVVYNETAPSTNRHIKVYLRTAANALGTEWAAGPTVLSAASIRDVAVVAVPRAGASGPTHYLVYADSAGDVAYFTSADNGSSWSGPTTIVALLDVKRLDAILTRMNRLIVVIAPDGALLAHLRYVYSDDLGVTWQTNAGAGYTMGAAPTADITDLAVTEDDRGNFWTYTAEGAGFVANPWRAYHGQGEGDPAVNAAEQTAGYFVGPDETANFTPSTIAAVSHPSGMVAVIGDVRDSGTSVTHLVSSIVARNRPLSVDQLVSDSTCGLGADDATPVAAALNAAGELVVAWCTPEAAGDPLWLRIGRWHPVDRNRPDLWHGGE